MFTGIVTNLGVVKKARRSGAGLELEVEAASIARELEVGDSVAINGVCQTATRASRRRFVTEAMEETLAVTTLGSLQRGSAVNLELPARLTDRIGGHLVQGHVDGPARVVRIEESQGATRAWLSPGSEALRYIVPRGSATIDGVSLTVVEVGRTSFQVALIPHTLEATTLKDLTVGSQVNLEVDIIAKYVARFTQSVGRHDR